MARRQSNDLLAPAIENWVIADNETANTTLGQGIESRVDLACGAGFQDIDLRQERPASQPRQQIAALHSINSLARGAQR